MSFNDVASVRAQYATEANLDLRRSVWLPTLDGRHPGCEALATIVSARPTAVLEVGCGTGEFAARVASALPDTDLVAIDQSERLVEVTSSRGVASRLADVQDLPFADDSFDVVAALWMLYHVPDLHRGLAEIGRVLRPGGTFVAMTNGDGHLAQLRRDAGGTPALTSFSSENGEDCAAPPLRGGESRRLRLAGGLPRPRFRGGLPGVLRRGRGLGAPGVRGAPRVRRPRHHVRRDRCGHLVTAPDRDFWDDEAARFDDEPDHGLRDPATRAAWLRLLGEHLPAAPADVVDLGCGTGSLSVLLAGAGHRVRGLDFSPAMVARARDKAAAADLDVEVVVGDAAAPPYADGSCDVVLCRHVLWALPDASAALSAWIRLLRPGGRLLLVEGRWHTGGGIAAAECERLVREHRTHVDVRHLPEEIYWGGPVTDERYLLVSAD